LKGEIHFLNGALSQDCGTSFHHSITWSIIIIAHVSVYSTRMYHISTVFGQPNLAFMRLKQADVRVKNVVPIWVPSENQAWQWNMPGVHIEKHVCHKGHDSDKILCVVFYYYYNQETLFFTQSKRT
jgi:hypothetical protein